MKKWCPWTLICIMLYLWWIKGNYICRIFLFYEYICRFVSWLDGGTHHLLDLDSLLAGQLLMITYTIFFKERCILLSLILFYLQCLISTRIILTKVIAHLYGQSIIFFFFFCWINTLLINPQRGTIKRERA